MINERLFEMRSNKLMSDFDYVPEGISEEQRALCEDCKYRWFRIDLDIAKYSCGRYTKRWFSKPEPSCAKDACLIDNEDIRKFIKASKYFIIGNEARK